MGVSATYDMAPGYTEFGQVIDKEINKKKGVEIDRPFVRLFEKVIAGEDNPTITYKGKSINVDQFNIISKDFAKKNNLKKNIFKDLKSILNLKKLNQDINFIANFGRDVEYYTGIVFEVFSGKKEIARGGRYDDLLKSLGAKKNTPAVGAAINLKNI